jgi:hypothetical protein
MGRRTVEALLIVKSEAELRLVTQKEGTEKGSSSIGRVAVSKTVGCGFESLLPCQLIRQSEFHNVRKIT